MPKHLRHKGILWKEYNDALVPESPPHLQINLDVSDCRHLLKESSAWMVRWPTNWDHPEETDWWYVIRDTPLTLELLSSNTRSKIRRGLRRNNVDQLSLAELRKSGYPTYEAAFQRYPGSVKPLSRDRFDREIGSLDSTVWEVWGCFDSDSGRMNAYSLNYLEAGAGEYKTIKFDPDGLRRYSSYALFWEMTNHYLATRDLRYVNDGARSVLHESQIQHFLCEKFGFRRAYCTLNIVYTPALAFAVQCLRPFDDLLASIPFPPLRKVNALLRQEAIRLGQRK